MSTSLIMDDPCGRCACPVILEAFTDTINAPVRGFRYIEDQPVDDSLWQPYASFAISGTAKVEFDGGEHTLEKVSFGGSLGYLDNLTFPAPTYYPAYGPGSVARNYAANGSVFPGSGAVDCGTDPTDYTTTDTANFGWDVVSAYDDAGVADLINPDFFGTITVCENTIAITLSDPLTVELWLADILNARTVEIPPVWSPVANAASVITGLTVTLASNQQNVNASASVYRWVVPAASLPRPAYRVSWTERYLADDDTGELASIEVHMPGAALPEITITGKGAGAVARAIMNAAGQVIGVHILNPGFGYDETTIVTFAAAINGGTTATGSATVVGGRITAITLTHGGDYLPTITVADPAEGGTVATASLTMTPDGGIDAVTLTEPGSGYGYADPPTLTLTHKVAPQISPVLDVHWGTETPRCATWDGIYPEGFAAEDSATWPKLKDSSTGNEWFTLTAPESGDAWLDHVHAYCDGTPCPE